MTRLAGLGATFHYESGLQARVPEGRELECFNAWNEAWTLLPADVERHGTFRCGGAAGGIISSFDRERILGVYERADGTRGWLLIFGDGAAVVTVAGGWKIVTDRRFDGSRLVTVTRSTG